MAFPASPGRITATGIIIGWGIGFVSSIYNPGYPEGTNVRITGRDSRPKR